MDFDSYDDYQLSQEQKSSSYIVQKIKDDLLIIG